MATATPSEEPKPDASKPKGAAKESDASNAAHDYLDQSRTQIESTMSAFSKNADAMRASAEDVAHALKACTDCASDNMKDLQAGVMSMIQDELTSTMDYASKAMRVQSPTELFELNRNFVSSLFETRFHRTKELAEHSVTAAREAAQPLNESVAAAWQSFSAMRPEWPANGKK